MVWYVSPWVPVSALKGWFAVLLVPFWLPSLLLGCVLGLLLERLFVFVLSKIPCRAGAAAPPRIVAAAPPRIVAAAPPRIVAAAPLDFSFLGDGI
jgi:hypothetical protein